MADIVYRALVDLDFPPDEHVAAGETTSKIPGKSIKWLLEQGLIEKHDPKNLGALIEIPGPEDARFFPAPEGSEG